MRSTERGGQGQTYTCRVRAWGDVADSYGATTEESTTITVEQYDYNSLGRRRPSEL